MAHFAEIKVIDGINTVLNVVVIPNEEEHRGSEYLANDLGLGGQWIQCSYNTRRGRHVRGGTPLRKNYPSSAAGWTYDSDRDAFIPPKPEKNPSFILDELTCTWIPPVPYPMDRYYYVWDEEKLEWKRHEKSINPEYSSWIWDAYDRTWVPPVPYPDDGLKYKWDESSLSWILIADKK